MRQAQTSGYRATPGSLEDQPQYADTPEAQAHEGGREHRPDDKPLVVEGQARERKPYTDEFTISQATADRMGLTVDGVPLKVEDYVISWPINTTGSAWNTVTMKDGIEDALDRNEGAHIIKKRDGSMVRRIDVVAMATPRSVWEEAQKRRAAEELEELAAEERALSADFSADSKEEKEYWKALSHEAIAAMGIGSSAGSRTAGLSLKEAYSSFPGGVAAAKDMMRANREAQRTWIDEGRAEYQQRTRGQSQVPVGDNGRLFDPSTGRMKGSELPARGQAAGRK